MNNITELRNEVQALPRGAQQRYNGVSHSASSLKHNKNDSVDQFLEAFGEFRAKITIFPGYILRKQRSATSPHFLQFRRPNHQRPSVPETLNPAIS